MMISNTKKANIVDFNPNKIQVLLVEDNDDDREHIAHMIQHNINGVVLKAVATGSEALDYFRANNVSCVILDYRLETEDGLTILAEMKNEVPFCPIIILTGQGNEVVAADSIKVGAADYLIKQQLTETNLKSSIEQAISRSALEAKVAEQEQDRKQFLKTLVHDLRSPLANINQLGEMVFEEMENGNVSALRDIVSKQQVVAGRAADLVTALEEYALLDRSIKFSTVSLAEIAKAASDNLTFMLETRHATIDIGALPSINGHQPQLIQLFQNLIQNALKYNENETPRVEVTSKNNAEQNVTITVKDNGIGIPAIHLSTIFEPLKRLYPRSQYEGTGLGLALCEKIVKRHGGKIWCTSVDGEGSEFHIQLPSRGANFVLPT